MAKVTFQPIAIWVAGEEKQAEVMNIRSISDDLDTSAQFYYELCEADIVNSYEDGSQSTQSGIVLASGNLTMSGQDYINWGNQSGTAINQWACAWALGKLNLTAPTV